MNSLSKSCGTLLLVLIIILLDPHTEAHTGGLSPESFNGNSFSIYVLSRGKGVPDTAWQVLKDIRRYFLSQQASGFTTRVHETIIGLEGERRICAEFIDEIAGRKAWIRAEAIVAGVELVNLRVEPCVPESKLNF